MAQAVKYNRSTNTSIKASGVFDADTMTIETEEAILSIKTLMRDFGGAEITFSVSSKTSEDLDIPEEVDEEIE